MASGWISQEMFEAELAALGCTSTARQHERWRNEGLLRPRPRQVANFKGSRVEHPASAARQILAIERAMATKSKVDWVGPILWAAGAEVDERHWRKMVETNEALTRRFASLARHGLDPDREGPTPGERIASFNPLRVALTKVVGRQSKPELARVLDVGAGVLSGDFETLDDVASEDEPFTTRSATVAAFDFAAGDQDSIDGNRLHLASQLGPMLLEIAKSNVLDDSETPSDGEIASARDDVRNGLKIALCLYEATSWAIGSQAFGLRQAARLARKATPSLIVAYALGLARLRRRQAPLLSSTEIAQLALQTEVYWLFSIHLRNRIQTSDSIGKKRLKLAISDSNQMADLIKEMGADDFLKTQFRPWDEWRKLSKTTTMSPGLLVMSIGAPSAWCPSDIAAGENEKPAP